LELFIPILIFGLGASIGSFISVLVYRIHSNKKGIIAGRSICPNCKKELSATDLIPIFSYVINGGKCRHCKKQISYHYLLLELSGGMIFLTIFLNFYFFNTDNFNIDWPMLLKFIFHLIYGSFLLAIFIYDLKYKEIPDVFLFPFIVIALLGTICTGSLNIFEILIAVVIVLFLFGGQILISKGKWLGEGDLYLSIAMALFLGWQKLLIAIIVSYIIGAIVSIILIIRKNAKMETAIAFAPFLVLGTFFAIFFGDFFIQSYLGLLNL